MYPAFVFNLRFHNLFYGTFPNQWPREIQTHTLNIDGTNKVNAAVYPRRDFRYCPLIVSLRGSLPVATRTRPDLFFFHTRCSIEFWYIKHLELANTRVANDDFDIIFGDWTDIHWSSPQIWDNEHQSFIRQVKPVAVHSHNDYTRRIPLWEALGSGCISVEADVTFHKSDLLVGHTRRTLKREDSLKAMYLEPLQRLFDMRNANLSEEAS